MSYITKERVKEWLEAALIRAVKTFAQTALALIPIGVSITEVGFPHVIGCAALAALLSILTSIAGLPEVDEGKSLPTIAGGE